MAMGGAGGGGGVFLFGTDGGGVLLFVLVFRTVGLITVACHHYRHIHCGPQVICKCMIFIRGVLGGG